MTTLATDHIMKLVRRHYENDEYQPPRYSKLPCDFYLKMRSDLFGRLEAIEKLLPTGVINTTRTYRQLIKVARCNITGYSDIYTACAICKLLIFIDTQLDTRIIYSE